MPRPDPTPIYRFVHIDNLRALLTRQALHAPLHVPDDGLGYKTIHNVDIQSQRRVTPIPRGPGGVIHDYVPFYFGPRSPMLYQLHTGWVPGYNDGQRPLIYVTASAQAVAEAGRRFVFSDGHGIAKFTSWFDDLESLDKLDWDAIYAVMWKDTVRDMDRQRKKQAEFLIYRRCPWSLIEEIVVLNPEVKAEVEDTLSQFAPNLRRNVRVKRAFYY